MDISARNESFKKIDINTDDIQKIVISSSQDSQEKAQDTAPAKPKEGTKSPIAQIISGNYQEAKKSMLGDFIQKVASMGTEIMTSPDKGQKNNAAMNEIRLIFGSDNLSSDKVTLSVGARMEQLNSKVSENKANKTKSNKDSTVNKSSADLLEELESHVFSERTDTRGQMNKLEEQNNFQNTQINDDKIMDNTDISNDLVDSVLEEIKSNEKKKDKVSSPSEKKVAALGDTEEDSSNSVGPEKEDSPNSVHQKNEESKIFRDKGNASSENNTPENEQNTDGDKELDDMLKDPIEDKKNRDNDIEKEIGGGRITLNNSNDRGQGEGGNHNSREQDRTTIRRSENTSKKEEVLSKTDVIAAYTNSFKQNILGAKKDIFALNQAENKLQKEYGLTSGQIKDIQLSVKKSIKMEIRDNIKDSIILKQLSILDKFDAATANAKLNNFSEYFVNNLLLGGQDFGNFDENFQGLINKAMYFASKELGDFAIGDLQDFVTSGSLDPKQDKVAKVKAFENKISELNTITNNPKITEEWAQTALESFMKNMGLTKENTDFNNPSAGSINVNVNTGGGNSGGQSEKQKHGYEFESKDEKDLFINRLRALYMQRALNPNIKTTMQTEFKIRRLKNGLLKMGVLTDVLNEKVKKEAQLIAKDRINDMLREALEERAAMYELQGPAYDLVENKIKSILKNADKVGLNIDKIEFEKLKTEVNNRMFEITKKEMEMLSVRMADEDMPALVLKHREMKKLTDRLIKESDIQDNHNSDSKFNSITIAETA